MSLSRASQLKAWKGNCKLHQRLFVLCCTKKSSTLMLYTHRIKRTSKDEINAINPGNQHFTDTHSMHAPC
ncbi:hypothetical protein DUNSADRAFT_7620 [Dunaliella salina]|uniref:Encoded protein n=1 Tax=Dunaliella salina TaxID=3046 RepID=A0ABQ7GL15_DUNSA|nr:hypothetical protein DUNSADRAFT_7620 [Dunaliella salina]|eukprot:KAF5835295.1 hypothetical protein DUNSADRAFT_7620 [Dunaliella salina]